MSYEIVNKFYLGGLQEFDQYIKLNPINIGNSEIISSLTRYKKFFSSSFTDKTNVIFILCSDPKDARKELINRKLYETLGVVNLAETYNLENTKDN